MLLCNNNNNYYYYRHHNYHHRISPSCNIIPPTPICATSANCVFTELGTLKMKINTLKFDININSLLHGVLIHYLILLVLCPFHFEPCLLSLLCLYAVSVIVVLAVNSVH
jgi:hypothetical protein